MCHNGKIPIAQKYHARDLYVGKQEIGCSNLTHDPQGHAGVGVKIQVSSNKEALLTKQASLRGW